MSNLKDVKQKDVEIELNGETFKVFYDLNSFAELEEKFGSLDEAFAELEKGKIKSVLQVLHAGMIHHNPELTPQEIGRMSTLRDIKKIGETLTKAIEQNLPETEEKDKKK